MSDPTFGLAFTVVDDEARPGLTANMSVVGLVGTAPAADAGVFPLNTPVQLYSDDTAMLASLGVTGTLYDAIAAINGQLGDFQVAASVVVVRVTDAGTVAGTIANLLGDINAKTGMYALLEAGELLGVTPRLIAVPGYTSQAINQVDHLTITNRGTGYTAAPTVAFSGGGGTGAAGTATLSNGVGSATVGVGGTGYTSAPTVTISAPDQPGGIQAVAHATVGSGAVTGIVIDTVGKGYSAPPTITFGGPGTGATATAVLTGVVDAVTLTNKGNGYTSAPTVAFSGGSGTGAAATAVLDTTTNAIVAGLDSLLSQLFGVAVVDGPSTNQAAAIAWRSSISSKRIIPTDLAAKILDTDGVSIVTVPLSPYILGIAVRRDHEFQGRPFHSWANQPIQGIVGVSRPIGFSLVDGATEGQVLLSHNIGVVVRGEATDTGIADGGYVFIGTDTCSPDSLWTFYNQVRGRDYIHLLFIRTLRFYLGRFNLTGQALQAVVNTMIFALRDLQAQGDILGFKVSFDRDLNSPEQLRLGKFTVNFAAEEPAPLRYLGVRSARYRPALDALLTNLLSQMDLSA